VCDGPRPTIAPIAAGRTEWVRSLGDVNAERWKELGYEPDGPPGGKSPAPVWARMPVIFDVGAGDGDRADPPDGAQQQSPRLERLLGRSPNPFVVRVLGGGSMEGSGEVDVFRAIVELQRLLRLSSMRGYADEMTAVRRGIDTVRAEHRRRLADEEAPDPSEAGYEDDPEGQQALAEVDQRFRDQALEVEDEWTSERKVAQLTAPSLALLAMKRTAQRMMAANKSNDQSMIARQIAEREAEESIAAGEKLAEGYQAALAQLRKQWEAERAAIRARGQTGRRKDAYGGQSQAKGRRVPTGGSHIKLGRDKMILRPFGSSKRGPL
jgi:hypothetical protein